MSDIESRIDKLERTINELRNELRTLRVLVRTDYPSALNKIRFITEKILGQLCKEHNISWGTAEPTLENMIGPLISKQIIPRPIAIHVRSVQANSSPGSHFQEAPLSAAHLEIAQMALVEFLEWYYSTRPNVGPIVDTPALLPADDTSKPNKRMKEKSGTSPRLPGWIIMAALFCVLLVVGIGLPLKYLFDRGKNPVDTTQTATAQTASPTTQAVVPGKPDIQIVMPDIDAHTKPIDDLCKAFEPRIKAYFNANNFVRAASIVSQYQLALLKRYPPSTFNNGLFQADSNNISINMPQFENWKPDDTLAVGTSADMLKAMGMDFLLDLQGSSPNDHLAIISADFSSILSRMGAADESNVDQSPQTFAKQFFRNFGNIALSDVMPLGSLRVIRISVNPGGGDKAMAGAVFEHHGVSYAIMSISDAANPNVNRERIENVLAAIKFDESPATEASIAQVRGQVKSMTDVNGMLTVVHDLALMGQYRQATQELSMITSALARMMPTPVIEGNVAEDASYGIRLRNPDPAQWDLSSSNMGVMNMMSLQAKTGNQGRYIGVAVINPTLTYGPRVSEMFGPTASIDQDKQFLEAAGTGGILNTGGAIESHDFTTFRGMLTCEIVGTNPGFPLSSMRQKALVMVQPSWCALMIIMAGTPDEIAQEQAMLDQILEIKMDTGTTPASPN